MQNQIEEDDDDGDDLQVEEEAKHGEIKVPKTVILNTTA